MTNQHNNSTQESVRSGVDTTSMWTGIVQAFIAVLTRPSSFFATMPPSGGFVQPFLFMLVMGLAGGFVRAVLGVSGLMHGVSVLMALAAIIMTPVMIAIFGFVGAAILFVVWKLMGSEQSFETAYRCAAYGSAISPVTQALTVIPYFGVLLGMAWWAFILVCASIRVHRIRRQTAIAVFGVTAAIFALVSVSGEYAVRHGNSMVDKALHDSKHGHGSAGNPGQSMQDLSKIFKQVGKAMQKQQKSNK